ncbi:MAG: UbiD family decarboxylase [Bacteroidetes bacterium]|jgi:4-hydroxy-3-polyprenylbenzoate decarboxylase|nr:UbiD family decarboxylase [Bacteroidota bacterium]MDF2453306.1 UbiD family decarboxylase [Bacteroidota bacterium]
MGYKSLKDCLDDLEKNNHLIRIKEEVDPNLEMAAIHLRVYEMGGPALLYENVKGTQFQCASNIYGTLERSKFIFRDTFSKIQDLIEIKNNPVKAFKNPFKYAGVSMAALSALPLKNPLSKPVLFKETTIDQLPLIKHWPMDGGAFVTLPQVYSEDIDKPGIMNSNLGMYRIQLNGNDYLLNKEIGLHYQLHRGIGVHQSKANKAGKPLKVSVFIGGPPSHAVAAVMPLPEGLSEMTFAGALGNRRFRYAYQDGFCVSTDADFVITGEVYPNENKPEGPFGDHLGYYSLKHDFPLMRVHKVYHREGAIWPFTVVGRPPQEDTSFGQIIHELTGNAIKHELPGVKEVHAVDAAGVHPLLLAIGSERYTPYNQTKQPAELLTIANHILGKGQLSLAKYLFITADDTNKLSTHKEAEFYQYILERIDLKRDLHFYTNTSIDTLDYSGTGLNSGSKLVVAAYGDKVRTLAKELNLSLKELKTFFYPQIALPGVLVFQSSKFESYEKAQEEFKNFNEEIKQKQIDLNGFPLIVLVDDSSFTAATLNNWLWITFTRSNPSHDVYGINSFTQFKHFGCDNMIIDARIKPHHAPVLERNPDIEKRVDKLFEKGGSLSSIK